MYSQASQAAAALARMIINSSFSLTVHPQSQAPCSTPVKDRHDFMLLATTLMQIANLRLRPRCL